MKIWIRIGLGKGSGQDGLQPPEGYCSAHAMSAWSPRSTLFSVSRPTKTSAIYFLRRRASRRRSAAMVCARFRVAGVRYTLTDTRSTGAAACSCKFQVRFTSPKTSSTTEKRRKIAHFSDISNRFWPKNRSYRKQTIKPRLTGARMHIRHFGFLALFDNRFHASNRRTRLKNERGFRGCWRTSTRFCSKSRTL